METTVETFSKLTGTNVRDLVLSSSYEENVHARSYPNTCCCELPGFVTSGPGGGGTAIYGLYRYVPL